MKQIRKLLISSIIAIVIIIALGQGNYIYNILFYINICLSIFFLQSLDDETYSLNKVTNIFIFVFLIIALGIQSKENNTVSSLNVTFTIKDYIIFQIVLLFIQILYNSLYFFFRKAKKKYASLEVQSYYVNENLLVLLSITFFIISFAYTGFNPYSLLFRGIEGGDLGYNTNSSSFALFLTHFCKPIPAMCLILAIIYRVRKFYLFILFLIALVALFPTSLGRNSVAMIWMPIVLLLFNDFFRRKYSFIIVMFMAFFFLFPFFDNFRYFNGTILFDFNLDYLNTMNFDAAQNFMFVLKENIITWGRQLLGVLTFFVPRSMWPNKPIGSGAYIASFQPGAFSNISMPFFGEGYINFGYLGIILFVIVLSYFTAKFDIKYWHNPAVNINYQNGYYLILVGALTFILRGDLMSSFAYTVGTCVSYFVVQKICLRRMYQ
jgi:oligosaccharide repeat unit polymerase